MKTGKTALILIGYQNDYFAESGILHSIIEESSRESKVLENTVDLLEKLDDTLIISTPIVFTDDYGELEEPVGILEKIKELGAFKKGTHGAEEIKEFEPFQNKITEVPGKIGLNAFHHTNLEELLIQNDISHLCFAGAVCSICIDSTGRSAFEKGYKVSIISDCTSGRTSFEKKFYCDSVFPLYASVITHDDMIQQQNKLAHAV